MTSDDDRPPFQTLSTNRFEKDIRRLRKSGYDLSKLEHIINLLSYDLGLPVSCKDHPLKGNMQDFRACHIKPDWLLIYRRNEEKLILLLIATGTHRDTLGME